MNAVLCVQIKILILILFVGFCYCFVVIPERTSVELINPKFVKWGNITVKRNGRKSDYYINLQGEILSEWNNNVTIQVLFYEFLHNEYRRSFVEFHFTLCDFLRKDHFIGTIISVYGIECPLPPRVYRFMNMTIPTARLPAKWPFNKFRADVELSQTTTKESMAKFSIFAVIKDFIPKRSG